MKLALSQTFLLLSVSAASAMDPSTIFTPPAGGGTGGGGGPIFSGDTSGGPFTVPEISGLHGTEALIAVAMILLVAWERRRARSRRA